MYCITPCPHGGSFVQGPLKKKKKKNGKKRRYFPYWPGNASPLLLVLIAVVHILYTHRHLWGHLHQENIVAELWNRVELIRLSMAGIPLSIMNNS